LERLLNTQDSVFDADAAIGNVMTSMPIKLGQYDGRNYIYVVSKDRKPIEYLDLKALLTKPRNLQLKDCVKNVRVHIDPLINRAINLRRFSL